MAKLEDYVQWFEDAETATLFARRDAERDRDYKDGKQYTAEERAILKKRKQPIITINRVKRKIEFMTGLEKQQRTDPKAFPRTPRHEDGAQAATDSIRFVLENNDFDAIRSHVWDNMLVDGFGACEVTVKKLPPKPNGRRFEIMIAHVPWDRCFYDPHSARHDFSDARYKGVVVWMDMTEADQKWPGKEIMSLEAHSSETYDDKPREVWVSKNRKRVRIVQIYYKEKGKWKAAVFTKGITLEEYDVPYLDEDNVTECPMVMMSAYVDRENQRYGAVRELISPQDEINKRRSKALHLLSVRQVKIRNMQVEDEHKVRQELAKPDGVIEVNEMDDLEILNTSDFAVGQMQLLQHATQEFDLMGPNAAMSGKSDKDQSGRAIIAQQQGGFIELATLLDQLRQFNLAVYRQVWNRIRQFWTEETWIRVTDDENNIRFAALNRPVDALAQITPSLLDRAAQIRAMLDDTQKFQALEELNLEAAQAAQQGTVIENNVAELDVDIILEEAPDTVTIQQETFQNLATMASAGIQLPPDVIIEASPLRQEIKERILERMRGGGDDPAAQQAAQIAAVRQQLDAEALSSKAKKDDASAEKAAAEAEQTRAETLQMFGGGAF